MTQNQNDTRLEFMDKCSTVQFSSQFRAPITDVLSMYPMLIEHLDEAGYAAASKIESSMYSILRNVRNIELYSKLEKTYFRLEILDIVELVTSVCAAVNSICDTKIDCTLCDGPIYIEGNGAIQTHALLGLVRNAFSYTQDKNSIRIGMEQTVNRVIIHVSDLGKGIKPEYQNQIFEPFFSVDPYGDCTELPGLGLDLAILERLQQHLAGSRPVISSNLGEGNTVSFSVPFIIDSDAIDRGRIESHSVAQLVTDRYSSLYLQLSGFCRLPM